MEIARKCWRRSSCLTGGSAASHWLQAAWRLMHADRVKAGECYGSEMSTIFFGVLPPIEIEHIIRDESQEMKRPRFRTQRQFIDPTDKSLRVRLSFLTDRGKVARVLYDGSFAKGSDFSLRCHTYPSTHLFGTDVSCAPPCSATFRLISNAKAEEWAQQKLSRFMLHLIH